MKRYLDPRNDLLFKRIFGENPHLLKSFLNALMPPEEHQGIVSLEYIPPGPALENSSRNAALVDALCTDKSGYQFIAEVQIYWTNDFTLRMIYHTSKAYVRQLGKKYYSSKLLPVYSLAILNEVYSSRTPEFFHRYRIMHSTTKKMQDGIEYVLIELSKFSPDKCTDRPEAALWLRFLKETAEDCDGVAEELQKHEDISRALKLCETDNFTGTDLEDYEKCRELILAEQETIVDGLEEGEEEEEE
jgi:predicted transposase/invertase (TIGR01784 family)